MRPGEVFAEKYRVERLLGQGGVGVVVAAQHMQLGHRVSIKQLKADRVSSETYLQRFLREARAAVSLRSEHVGRVLDFGNFEGNPYIVMEYLDGQDLREYLEERGKLEVGEAVGYILQACQALAEAHTRGIVHRDLKPSNLFLTRAPSGAPMIKVLDFGMAKASAEPDQAITSENEIVGTPLYMSPEQVRTPLEVDHRTDVWSIGISLYELVTGAPPWHGETFASTCMMILSDPPPPLPAGMPAGFQKVLFRCLEKDPSRRYPDVLSLASDLARYADPGLPVSSWTAPGIISAKRTSPWPILGTILAVGFAVGVTAGAWRIIADRGDEPAVAPVAPVSSSVSDDAPPAKAETKAEANVDDPEPAVSATAPAVASTEGEGEAEARDKTADSPVAATVDSPAAQRRPRRRVRRRRRVERRVSPPATSDAKPAKAKDLYSTRK